MIYIYCLESEMQHNYAYSWNSVDLNGTYNHGNGKCISLLYKTEFLKIFEYKLKIITMIKKLLIVLDIVLSVYLL